MKSYYSVSLISLFLVFAACDALSLQKAKQEVDILIFGVNYGECIGECFTVYKLANSQLWEDTSTISLGDYLNYEFLNERLLDQAAYEEVQALMTNVPQELVNSENKKFGCPDCYDQGGVFIQLKKGDITRRFVIDTDDSDDQSSEVVTFKKAVIDGIEGLRN